MAHGRQEPWLEMKPFRKPFYFVPPENDRDDDGGGDTSADQVKVQRMETERKFWASIEGSRNPAKFRAYLEKYGEDGGVCRVGAHRARGAGRRQWCGSGGG